jgi:uncharacterized damage-inducible protein DinB
MCADIRQRLLISPLPSAEEEIGRCLWRLEDTRSRTKQSLAGIDQAALDWTPDNQGNSIGTLLYHLALIEADWLFAEVLEQPVPPDLARLFTSDARDESGQLSRVEGKSLEQHLALLESVRALVLATYSEMMAGDFRRPRRLPDYDVTPEWVLHHLIQHEAEHRGQIGEIRQLAAASGQLDHGSMETHRRQVTDNPGER